MLRVKNYVSMVRKRSQRLSFSVPPLWFTIKNYFKFCVGPLGDTLLWDTRKQYLVPKSYCSLTIKLLMSTAGTRYDLPTKTNFMKKYWKIHTICSKNLKIYFVMTVKAIGGVRVKKIIFGLYERSPCVGKGAFYGMST